MQDQGIQLDNFTRNKVLGTVYGRHTSWNCADESDVYNTMNVSKMSVLIIIYINLLLRATTYYCLKPPTSLKI